jgi:hypothetical protein
MQIDISGIPTPRNHTPPSIAPEHFPTSRWRRVLCRAPTLQSSWRHTRFATHAGVCVRDPSSSASHPDVCVRDLSGSASHLAVCVRDLSGSASHLAIGVRDLSGSASHLGVSVCDLSGPMRGAAR